MIMRSFKSSESMWTRKSTQGKQLAHGLTLNKEPFTLQLVFSNNTVCIRTDDQFNTVCLRCVMQELVTDLCNERGK